MKPLNRVARWPFLRPFLGILAVFDFDGRKEKNNGYWPYTEKHGLFWPYREFWPGKHKKGAFSFIFFFQNTPLQFSFQIWLTFQKSQKCNKNSKFLHVWVLTPLIFLLEKIGRKWPYSDFPIGRIQLKVPGNPDIDWVFSSNLYSGIYKVYKLYDTLLHVLIQSDILNKSLHASNIA